MSDVSGAQTARTSQTRPEAQPSAPTQFIGAPVLLLNDPSYVPPAQPVPTGRAHAFMELLARLAVVDSEDEAGEVIVHVIDPATGDGATFQYGATVLDRVTDALTKAFPAAKGGEQL